MINALLEKGALPDAVIRFGIRQLLATKIKVEQKKYSDPDYFNGFVQILKDSPIAINTQEANEQHYEVPTEFFKYVMGDHLKYSCGYWKDGVTDFTQSEKDMLELTAKRADLKDGHKIMEWGCGWGSLSLYMAKNFPKAQITGVSNSSTQKAYIDQQAKERGLTNLTIITADMNEFAIDQKFDRLVSVEMFEHMRNYQKLLAKAASFLNDDGKLFVHIFTHRNYAYTYEVNHGFDWMARYFFTGGVMPSDDLLLHFADDFAIDKHWRVNGQHYEKTSNGWLENMDTHKEEILKLFKDTYSEEYKKWWNYWRIFFMACAELWGFDSGREWIVSHYLFNKR